MSDEFGKQGKGSQDQRKGQDQRTDQRTARPQGADPSSSMGMEEHEEGGISSGNQDHGQSQKQRPSKDPRQGNPSRSDDKGSRQAGGAPFDSERSGSSDGRSGSGRKP
jgi:hypothetical protein